MVSGVCYEIYVRTDFVGCRLVHAVFVPTKLCDCATRATQSHSHTCSSIRQIPSDGPTAQKIIIIRETTASTAIATAFSLRVDATVAAAPNKQEK